MDFSEFTVGAHAEDRGKKRKGGTHSQKFSTRTCYRSIRDLL